MKYEFDVMERLIILNILPKENNFTTLKIIRDLKDKLGFSEEEHKLFEIKLSDQGFQWNKKGKEKKSFEIGEKAQDLIKESLEDLDTKKKLTEEMMGLFQLFVK